eukprot:gene28792-biopygen32695
MLWLTPIVLLLASSSTCASLVSRKLQDASPMAVNLGRATNFSVLAYATVTNSGYTLVGGHIGVCPGSEITGEGLIFYFPEPTPNGRIGTEESSAAAAAAKHDLTAAYLDASLRVENVKSLMPAVYDMGGRTFTPGLYKTTSSLEVLTGNVYLSGTGVFIFQMESTLVVHTTMKMVLLDGALASNVFWRVGTSATFNAGSEVVGTVMALASISVLTGVTITGRLFALNGAITLMGDVIAFPLPACLPTEYELIRAAPTYDRFCMALATCSANEYESVAPNANTNRVCSALTDCPPGSFQSVAPDANTSQVCSDWLNTRPAEHQILISPQNPVSFHSLMLADWLNTRLDNLYRV